MGKLKSILIFVGMVFLMGGAGAETITKPHNFTSGTTISSSQMNENFDIIFQELNRLRIALKTCQCNGSASLSEGLVAYYPFNGNANDESGNGNDGTVNGATLTEDRFGNTGSAYGFDGVDDYINKGNLNNIDVSGSVTISVWIYKKSTAQKNIVNISQSLGSSQPQFGMLYSLEKIRVQTKDNNNNWGMNSDYGNAVIPVESWHHLVFTFSTPNYNFYLNGLPDGLGVWDNHIRNNDTNPYLYIGTRGDLFNTHFFDGSIDDVRIYNRALSSSEVRTLYDHEKP